MKGKTVDLKQRLEENSDLPKEVFRVALASQSQIKIEAVEKILERWNIKYSLVAFSIKDDKQIPQPLGEGSGMAMARNRIQWLYQNHPKIGQEFHLIISIENYISETKDIACVLLYDPRHDCEYLTHQFCAYIPDCNLLNMIIKNFPIYNDQRKLIGTTKTFGEAYQELNPIIPADNWMLVNGCSRSQSLVLGIQQLAYQYRKDIDMFINLESAFRYIPNYPIPGVNYKVWDDIFLNPELMASLIQYLARKYESEIDYVIGVESRGFLLSSRLATKMNVSEVLLRKKGKVVGPKVTQSYTKEYGEDVLELRADLPPGKVIICDDILATGGSLEAAVRLARTAGHKVIDCIVVQDVPDLRDVASEKLKDVPIRVLIKEKPFMVFERN